MRCKATGEEQRLDHMTRWFTSWQSGWTHMQQTQKQEIRQRNNPITKNGRATSLISQWCRQRQTRWRNSRKRRTTTGMWPRRPRQRRRPWTSRSHRTSITSGSRAGKTTAARHESYSGTVSGHSSAQILRNLRRIYQWSAQQNHTEEQTVDIPVARRMSMGLTPFGFSYPF